MCYHLKTELNQFCLLSIEIDKSRVWRQNVQFCLWTDTRVGEGNSALREGCCSLQRAAVTASSSCQLSPPSLGQTVAIRRRLQILWLVHLELNIQARCTDVHWTLPLYCTTPHPFKFALLCHENINDLKAKCYLTDT